MYDDSWIGLAIVIVGAVLAWVMLRRVFRFRWWAIGVVVMIAPEVGLAQARNYFEVRMQGTSTWLNPLGGTDHSHYFYYPGQRNPSITISSPAIYVVVIQVPAVRFVGEDGEYYIGYVTLFEAGNPSLTSKRIGVLANGFSSGEPRCFINTDGGEWKEIFRGALGQNATVSMAHAFWRSSATAANSASVPELAAENTGSVSSFGYVLTVLDYTEGDASLTTQPATTQSYDDLFPATAPVGDYEKVDEKLPPTSKPTTLPFLEQWNTKFQFDDGDDGIWPRVKAEADTAMTSIHSEPVFAMPGEFTASASASAALEDVMSVGQAIWPSAMSGDQFTGDGIAAMVFDGSPRYLIGQAITGYASAVDFFEEPLEWVRAIVEMALWVGVLYYAIRRYGWALGSEPGQLIPPGFDPWFLLAGRLPFFDDDGSDETHEERMEREYPVAEYTMKPRFKGGPH